MIARVIIGVAAQDVEGKASKELPKILLRVLESEHREGGDKRLSTPSAFLPLTVDTRIEHNQFSVKARVKNSCRQLFADQG